MAKLARLLAHDRPCDRGFTTVKTAIAAAFRGL
jgi:hypothetical protein